MKIKKNLIALCCAALLGAPGVIAAESATAVFAAADAAAKANPEDSALAKQRMELRKVMQREKLFYQEENPELAAKLARQLRRFYYGRQMWNAAEQLDRRMMLLQPGNAATENLGETLLAAGRNQEAVELLAPVAWTAEERTGKLHTALAFARQGDVVKAEAYLADVSDGNLTARECYLATSVAARLGKVAVAAAGVVQLLSAAPAKESEMLRNMLVSGDFVPVSNAPEYQEALKTESKAGHGCGGCPNRGTSRCGGGDCD